MKTNKTWAIWSYDVSTPFIGGWIASSIGYPYAELRHIARRMGRNGEGRRYEVRELKRQPSSLLA